MLKRYIDIVAANARRTPQADAVVAEDNRLSFGVLDDRVGRLGGALRTAGLRTGDRVSLLASNELEYVEVRAACGRSRLPLVPLNPRLAVPELEYIIGDSAPAVLIGGRGEHERAARLGKERGIRLLGLGGDRSVDAVEPYDEFMGAGVADPEADPLAADLITTFLYTSGTTGRPKGAMIDRAGMMARVFVNALEMNVRPQDRFLHTLPMFHIGAFLTYAVLFRGGSTVMLPTFTPEGWYETLEREQCTMTVLVPTLIQMLLESEASTTHDVSSLQLIVYGGSSIEPPLLRRAIERFDCDFHQQYGMTETGAQTILRPDDHDPADDQALASGGTAAVSFDVRVVDRDDVVVHDGEIGDIVGRGHAVMSGYWNLPEATAETLRNGWMHTGDLGRFDDRGYLHVVDRRNDMIVSGGENVYPREVESVLIEHPEVADCAVIGLPDPKWGEVVTGVVAGEAPADEVLDAYLRGHLAAYKVPKRWIRVDELPRNVTGKVLKVDLRQRFGPGI